MQQLEDSPEQHVHNHHTVHRSISSAAMKVKSHPLRRRLTWNGKTMRAQLAQQANRLRSTSLNAVPPPRESADFDYNLAREAASILYRTPIPSPSGLPIYILNAAALPDTDEVDFDSLLPYVLARLPGEEELLSGTEYEVIFFAGGDAERAAGAKKNRPGWGWFIQAYHVLSRAMRKRLQKLYIVHERSWVRILVEMFSTVASPKFRRKIVHVSTLSQLALHLPIEDLLIPPSAYLHDRRLSSTIYAPYASGRRAFSVRQPFPQNTKGETRLPRVLREATTFLLLDPNIRTEGLFRIPPHNRLKEILKEAYDRGQKYILWKENGVTLPVPAYDNAQAVQTIINEVDPRDSYGVYLAAGIIKVWYAELRQPIFPQSSYKELRAHFGNPEDPPTMEQLVELLSPKSEWSAIPAISRAILIRHLLPLLSLIAEHQDDNKMTAENLAVCFAPTLLCGPDQIEDAKISSVVRRILTEAIEFWTEGLREACGLDASTFEHELRAPSDPQDYEDPLEAARRPLSTGGQSDWTTDSPSEEDAGFADSEKQFTGILLKDNEAGAEAPPALPPRPSTSSRSQESPVSPSFSQSSDSALRRKPAPSVTVPSGPPRYSSILADEAAGHSVATESPATYVATTDGFGPARRSGWSVDEKKEEKSSAKGPTTSIPHIIVPKRKALTTEQISNMESNSSPDSYVAPTQQAQQPAHTERRPSQSKLAGPPQLADLIGAAALHRKPLQAGASRPGSSESGKAKDSPTKLESPSLMSPTALSPESRRPSLSPQDAEFRRQDLRASMSARRLSASSTTSPVGSEYTPAGSRSRGPTITSLARPVYPTTTPSPNNVAPGAPPRATTLPSTSEAAVAPKVKPMSAGLLKRMSSFEPPPIPKNDRGVHKLDLKKKSVDDLRKLYEVRAGTAQKLVNLGNERQNGTV